MYKAFKHADLNKDNTLNWSEFLHLINAYMMPLTAEGMNGVLKHLGLENGKKINYMEFLKKFQDSENLEKGHPWLFTKYVFNDSRPLNNVSAERAFRMLAEKVADQWLTLADAYRNFNRDLSDSIDKNELKTILHRFNIPVGGEEFERLWRMFDADGNGSIDNNEFLKKLGTELAPGDQGGLSSKIYRGNTIALQMHETKQRELNAKTLKNQILSNKFITAQELEQRLRDKFRDGFESFKKAFRKMDKNLDGSLSRKEFMHVLNCFHYHIEPNEFEILMKNVGLDLAEKISYTDFLEAFDVTNKKNQSPSSPCYSPRFSNGNQINDAELFQVLKKMIRDNSESLEKGFVRVDSDGKGFMSMEKLHQVIRRSFMNLTKRQFMGFLTHIGLPNKGSITCNIFLDAINKSTSPRRVSFDEESLKIKRNLVGNQSSISFDHNHQTKRSRDTDIFTLDEEKKYHDRPRSQQIRIHRSGDEVMEDHRPKSENRENEDELKLPDIQTSPRKDNSAAIEIMIKKCWQKLFRLCRKHSAYSVKMKIKQFCDVLGSQGIYATEDDIRLLMKAYGMVSDEEVPYTDLLKMIVKKSMV